MTINWKNTGGENVPKIKVVINDCYLPYLEREDKFQCFYGGSGSGKSRFICQKIVLNCIKSQRKVLVLRQTFASIRQSVFQELKTVISDMGLYNIVRIKETDMTIQFPHNDSVIIFKGLDDIEKIKSISGVTDAFIEEASEVQDKAVFDQLVLRIRPAIGIKPIIYLSWNPVSASHWLKEFVEIELPEKDGFFLKTTYLDNKFLSDDYIENLEQLKKTNPHFWKIYGEGEWGTMGKLVYSNYEVLDFEEEDIVKQYRNIRSLCGLDFGYVADPTAFIHILVDEKTKQLWVCPRMLYQSGMLNNEIAEWIIDNGFSKSDIVADSAEQKSIADISNNGVRRIKPAKKGKGSVASGIAYVSQYKMYVHPSCTAFLNEVQNYSFKKNKEGIYTNEPIDKYNHLLDALRYAMEELIFKSGRITTLNKSVLGL